MTSYDTLHRTAAWIDLSDRGKIRVTGRDRVRFLHNLLSNDVKGLSPGQSSYHFLLNAQGRIQGDANLFVYEDRMLIDCEPEMTGRIIAHLRRYIIGDQVGLEDATAGMATIAVEGPGAAEAAAEAPACSLTGETGRWFLVGRNEANGLVARLGLPEATAAEARIVRVENVIPRYGEDFFETTLPQETQQTRAICFTKGCYLGQEIVERIRARGQVHKLLVRVGIDGADPPAAGSPVNASGQQAGTLTSPVYSPGLGHSLGLAILRRELAEPGAALEVAGRAARVL